jgi:hypothetical protein
MSRVWPCRFDALLGEHSVYKVETIGDCYMVAGGLVFTDAQGYTSVMQSKVRVGRVLMVACTGFQIGCGCSG